MQGALEASNVNVVEEMVNMIETQRAYEVNSKAISAVDGMLNSLTITYKVKIMFRNIYLSFIFLILIGCAATKPVQPTLNCSSYAS